VIKIICTSEPYSLRTVRQDFWRTLAMRFTSPFIASEDGRRQMAAGNRNAMMDTFAEQRSCSEWTLTKVIGTYTEIT